MAGGGGGGTGPGGRKKARIEIIPLIDIMFFLLAAFMLVSLSMLKIQGLKGVELPRAKSSQPENKPDFLTLSITKTGDLGIDKDSVRIEDLVPRLNKRLEEDARLKRDTRVYLNADRDTPHRLVVEALDRVRSAKVSTAGGPPLTITKISFAIQAGGGGEPATTADAPQEMKHLSANVPAPRRKARIEIIPLIDIMFFLLASFMLIALAMIRLQGMAMNLPSKIPPPPPPPDQPKPEVVKVDIGPTGEYSIEKVPISPAELESMLQKKFDADVKNSTAKENMDTRVFINADANSTHGMVIDLLDKVRTIGIKKVSFSLKAKAPSAPGATTTGTAPGAPPAAPPAAPAAPAATAPPAPAKP